MEQQCILVIEDDLAWQKLIRRYLDGAGYSVHIVGTCAEGVKLAELHKPDCIISDFHLPDGDAVSICSAIRSNENTKTPSIIIFSSDPGVEATAYKECQAASFMLKGGGALAELPAAISNMLALR